MTIKEIMEFRDKNVQKEEEMWVELFNEKYPIGKVVEIDGEETEAQIYALQQKVYQMQTRVF